MLEKARTLFTAAMLSLAASSFLYSSFAGDAFAAFSSPRVSSKCETFMSIARRLGMKRSPGVFDERLAEPMRWVVARFVGVPIRAS